jgi:hypothetical protein
MSSPRLEILLDLSFILRPENCAYFSEDAAPNQFWTPGRRERPGSSPYANSFLCELNEQNILTLLCDYL